MRAVCHAPKRRTEKAKAFSGGATQMPYGFLFFSMSQANLI